MAQAFFRVEEPPTDKVAAICSGMGAGGGGRRKRLRRSGRVLEVEERGREDRDRVGHPHGGGGADIHVVAAVVCDSRSNVEGTGGMGRPRRTDRSRVESVA